MAVCISYIPLVWKCLFLPGLPLCMFLIVVCTVSRNSFQLSSGKLQGGVQTVQFRSLYVIWRVRMVRSMRLRGNASQSGIRLQVEWRTCRLWTMRTSMATVKVWKQLLLEMLTVSQLIKKFSTSHAIRNFITMFTTVRRWSLSRVTSIQFKPSYRIPRRYEIILICKPRSQKWSRPFRHSD